MDQIHLIEHKFAFLNSTQKQTFRAHENMHTDGSCSRLHAASKTHVREPSKHTHTPQKAWKSAGGVDWQLRSADVTFTLKTRRLQSGSCRLWSIKTSTPRHEFDSYLVAGSVCWAVWSSFWKTNRQNTVGLLFLFCTQVWAPPLSGTRRSLLTQTQTLCVDMLSFSWKAQML